jgi:hypothetical protein
MHEDHTLERRRRVLRGLAARRMAWMWRWLRTIAEESVEVDELVVQQRIAFGSSGHDGPP